MRRMNLLRILLLFWLVAVASCSTDREPGELFAPGEVNVLVVDAVLIVGEPFPPVLLSRTQAPDAAFDLDAARVSGASVSINGSDGSTQSYIERTPGVYWHRSTTLPPEMILVRPSTTYRLEVRTAEGEFLTALTTTPAAFSVRDWLLLDEMGETVLRRLSTFSEHGDTLYARPENQLVYTRGLLEARFAREGYVGFQIGLSSIDRDSPFVIDPDFFEDEDFEDLQRNISSPAFDAEDGTVRLPWFAIFFEGRYVTRIFALDRNWYDLARSLPGLGGEGPGFGGQAGDDFDRPLFHVEGGIGLFGSAAVDSVGFTILPR